MANEEIKVEEYLPHEDAEFTAYMDIQLETDILLPLNEAIVEYSN